MNNLNGLGPEEDALKNSCKSTKFNLIHVAADFTESAFQQIAGRHMGWP
jgi:hypothetical protein